MKITRNIALFLTVLALGALPAMALASGNGNHGKSSTAPGHTKSTSSTKPKTTPSSTHAYGYYCAKAGAQKKNPAGTHGKTPFAQCVTGLAHAAKSPAENPAKACASADKKHGTGQKGKTAFAACVAAVKDYRHSTS